MNMAIVKKDFRGIVFNKRLFPVLIIVPLVLTVILPAAFILAVRFAPEDVGEINEIIALLPTSQADGPPERALTVFLIDHLMPVFFMIIPVMAASVMAASSFVGEKEKRTLETLLYAPLTLRDIFISKVLASSLLSMLVSLVAFFAMMLVVEAGIWLTTGAPHPPSVNWLPIMLFVAPAISILAITLIVGASAKAETVEESQQRAVFLVLPLLLLLAGQFTGLILIDVWLLLGFGLFIAALAAVMLRLTARKFTYESLLR